MTTPVHETYSSCLVTQFPMNHPYSRNWQQHIMCKTEQRLSNPKALFLGLWFSGKFLPSESRQSFMDSPDHSVWLLKTPPWNPGGLIRIPTMGYNTLYIPKVFQKETRTHYGSNPNQPTNQSFCVFLFPVQKTCCQVTFQDDPNFQGSVEVQVVGKDLQSAGPLSLRHASLVEVGWEMERLRNPTISTNLEGFMISGGYNYISGKKLLHFGWVLKIWPNDFTYYPTEM